MKSIRFHPIIFIFLVRLGCSHTLFLREMPRLSTENDSKSTVPTNDSNIHSSSTTKQTSLREEFGDELFPVRLMVTLDDNNLSFLEIGSTLKEAVEGSPVVRFEHLTNVDCIMLELSEDCTRAELDTLIKELKDLGGYVEFDDLAHLASIPEDYLVSHRSRPHEEHLNHEENETKWKYHPNQWYIKTLKIDKAWNELRDVPLRDVRVCVVDTGVDYRHKGLIGRIATEPAVKRKGAETDSNVDDNKKSNSEEMISANFVDNNSDPMDYNGHGTHIAGVIAANSETSEVAGINPMAKIIPCKAFSKNTSSRLSNLVSCIDFCLFAGAEIQNHSWVVSKDFKFLRRAFQMSLQMNVVMVVAAGNYNVLAKHGMVPLAQEFSTSNNIDIDKTIQYPASYSRMFPNVLATANLMVIDRKKSRELMLKCIWRSFQYCSRRSKLVLHEDSMYGPATVQVAAPGTHIYSLFPSNSYVYLTGTSVSTAVVTGLVSLVRSIIPKTSDEFRRDCVRIIEIIRESIKVTPGLEDKVGWKGYPDCLAAVRLSKSIIIRHERKLRRLNLRDMGIDV